MATVPPTRRMMMASKPSTNAKLYRVVKKSEIVMTFIEANEAVDQYVKDFGVRPITAQKDLFNLLMDPTCYYSQNLEVYWTGSVRLALQGTNLTEADLSINIPQVA
jgi:hypothetical protein